jgi:hypothetical protein
MAPIGTLSTLDGGTLFPRIATSPDEYRTIGKTFMGTIISKDGLTSLFSIYDSARNGDLSLADRIDKYPSTPIILSLYSNSAYTDLFWEGAMAWISMASGSLPSSASMAYDYNTSSLVITRGSEVISLADSTSTLPSSSSGNDSASASFPTVNIAVSETADDTISKIENLTGTKRKADTLTFDYTPSYGTATADKITNFSPKEKDKLHISLYQFGSGAEGTFKIARNVKDLKKMLTTTTDFIYLRNTGELYYNENSATPGFGKGGVFAILDGHPNISALDIEFI